MSAIARLDPRRHLSAAIGWATFVIIALASLAAANVVSADAERAAVSDTERLLNQFAAQIGDALDTSLSTRLSIVQATAAQIVASGDRGPDAVRRHLEALQAQFPEFAWLGLADPQGRIVAATGGALVGDSVAAQPWFRRAQSVPYLGTSRATAPKEADPTGEAGGKPQRFVDAAAPLGDATERPRGVIGARLSWAWIERLQAGLLGSLDTRRRLQLMLANGDGLVLAGPAQWLGRTLDPNGGLTEGGAYVVGRDDDARAAGGLSWTVIVRQPASEALAAARGLRASVLSTVLLAGLMTGLAALAVTGVLTRRLAALDADAQAVRRGLRASVPVPPGLDEVGRLGATIAELIGHLQQEKAALAALNAELEARVTERTAKIERMAGEARHAAVTRERLRLARDLHDTLAHSLMALLTQIRVVRKLRGRLSADEFDAELARAEQAAASGLAEARAAIGQMRHNSVRDAGLGPAIDDVLRRFGERSGVATSLRAEAVAASMADETAETVFRIVEEALHNVERHARAGSVVVTLAKQPPGERVVVTVADDGVGFDPASAQPGHYGLIGIREQAALIGARVAWDSAPSRGTTMRLELPA